MMKFKPMLAGKAPEDRSDLRFPLIVSPKLDGIRCITMPVWDGDEGQLSVALTRKLKPIPNDFVRNWIEHNVPPGVDGELLLSNWTAPFRQVSSAMMKRTGEPAFHYAAFDYVDFDDPEQPFTARFKDLMELKWETTEWKFGDDVRLKGVVRLEGITGPDRKHLQVVSHVEVTDAEELLEAHLRHIEWGFEGTMVRQPWGPYKFGRSTTKEGYLLKIKDFADEEATIIGFVEQMHNTNELQRDNLGHAKRSSAKDGKVGKNTLGALRCRFEDGTEFECGTGFDDATRQAFWINQEVFMGGVVTIKHQPDPGGRLPGQAPRFPVYKGMRED